MPTPSADHAAKDDGTQRGKNHKDLTNSFCKIMIYVAEVSFFENTQTLLAAFVHHQHMT